jgi:capsular polysaccharide export protein
MARDGAHAVQLAKKRGGAIAGWASRIPADLDGLARDADIALWRIEDGFIRSQGLGAALHLPCSIVVDRSGIYYDPGQSSDLEKVLEKNAFGDAERQRSRQLIDLLRSSRVTKYNLAGSVPALPSGRRLVLVPGQVNDDRSVLLGGQGLDNAALLNRVRAIEPDAFIVYKPHPDVVAGMRQGAFAAVADLVVPDADLLSLIERVDAVHVLSSLTGFEALLRGKTVHVHGQPFYAGWGLTVDYAPVLRRTAKLDLEALVAGTLLSYPLYCHPNTGRPIAVEELVMMLAQSAGHKRKADWWRIMAGSAALALRRWMV